MGYDFSTEQAFNDHHNLQYSKFHRHTCDFTFMLFKFGINSNTRYFGFLAQSLGQSHPQRINKVISAYSWVKKKSRICVRKVGKAYQMVAKTVPTLKLERGFSFCSSVGWKEMHKQLILDSTSKLSGNICRLGETKVTSAPGSIL